MTGVVGRASNQGQWYAPSGSRPPQGGSTGLCRGTGSEKPEYTAKGSRGRNYRALSPDHAATGRQCNLKSIPAGPSLHCGVFVAPHCTHDLLVCDTAPMLALLPRPSPGCDAAYTCAPVVLSSSPLSSNPVLEGTDQLPEPGDVVRQASIWPGHAAAPGPTLKSLEALGSNRLPITSISQAMAPEPIGGNPNAGFAEKRLTVPARFISNGCRSCPSPCWCLLVLPGRCGVAIFGNLFVRERAGVMMWL